MYTARYLGAAGFGILSFALAFTGIFGVFGDLGLGPLTVREVARDKSLASKYLANISLMKIILVVITFGFIALTINLMGYPEETIKVVYLFGLSVIFMAFTQMFYSIFQAYERMEYQGIGQMVNAALILGGVILAIKYGLSVVSFAFLFFIASVIVLVYSLAVMKLKFSNSAASPTEVMEFDWSFWKPTIKEALPFGLSAIFVTVYFWIDTVMLSVMKGDVVVGWYNAAYRMVYVLLFIPSAYFGSVYPVMSQFYESSRESLRFTYERSARYMLAIGFPLGVGASLLASRIILLIYGAQYAPATVGLQVLIWAVFLSFLSHTPMYTLNSINKQRIYTYVVSLSMVLNIILNLVLIPRFSYIGASIATVATELIAFALLFTYGSRLFGNPYRFTLIMKIVSSALAMATFVIFCGKFLNLGWLIFIGALIYLGMMLLLRGFSKDELLLLRRLISLPNTGGRHGG